VKKAYDDPKWQASCHLLAELFSHKECIYLGGMGSSKQLLSCDFEECSWQDIQGLSYSDIVTRLDDVTSHQDNAFKSCYVALLSYDDFSFLDTMSPSRLFKIHGEVCIDDHLDIELKGNISEETRSYIDRYCQNFPKEKRRLWQKGCDLSANDTTIEWVSQNSQEDYLKCVRNIQKDIEKGRYYQLNYLRYFILKNVTYSLSKVHTKSKEHLQNAKNLHWIMQRFARFGEHMSAVIALQEEAVVSFSPERFVDIVPYGSSQDLKYLLSTYPIKGTAPRYASKQKDRLSAEHLKASLKDQAELNMIVDLMRHDLAQVCERGSVNVLNPGRVHGFRSVFHRMAHIQGIMDSSLNMDRLCRTLLPAGSITGAPKKEVIGAIREYEQKGRGYFMGHICWLRPGGFLDSSLLIRTLHLTTHKAEYAAGSGIVIHSVAEKEYEEVKAKSRMWTDGTDDT